MTEVLEKLAAIEAKMDRLERRLWLQDKAVYRQEEIIEAMGLKGEQRNLLKQMKDMGLLHSPINKSPLIYPGEVVREAIKEISKSKKRQQFRRRS